MKNNPNENHAKSFQHAHYIVTHVPIWAEEGLAIQPLINSTSQEREQAARFSRVPAWEWQPRLWLLQICCNTPRDTNTGHWNNKQHSPAPKGKPKQTSPAEESFPLHLNFCSCFTLTFTLWQGLHPLPHQAVMHHAAARSSSVRNGLSQQPKLAVPSLPIISIPPATTVAWTALWPELGN